MIRAVFRNELIKTVHRLAFWVTFIFFCGGTTIGYLESYLRARHDAERTFALPGAWQDIIADDPEVAFIFGSVILILLVANEFTWRTARQNVIDGLSKEQFFVGKLLLIPVIVVVFEGARLLSGGIFGFLGREAAGAPLIEGPHWSALGGVTLAFVGFLALALFIALAVRSGGAAMGVLLLYFAIVENLVAGGLARISDSLEPVAAFLPVRSFSALTRYIQHDPRAFEAAVQRALENNRQPPELTDPATLWLVPLAWTLILLGAAFVWFRKRDL
jgi:ABC-type transport system involved in multi-copper enzyme maturation permease subunit